MIVELPGTPTIEQVKAWVGTSTAIGVPPADFALMYDSARERQQEVTTLVEKYEAAVLVDPDTDWTMPATCKEALMRRVARAVASKAYPLGQIIGDQEFMGAVTISRWDAEIDDKESQYRRWGIA